jgi:hypothetical protein
MQTINQIINEALGEASALFMSQECKGTEIIMPTKKLNDIAIRATHEIVKLIKNK